MAADVMASAGVVVLSVLMVVVIALVGAVRSQLLVVSLVVVTVAGVLVTAAVHKHLCLVHCRPLPPVLTWHKTLCLGVDTG